jgi:DNA-binding NarL/FixJ family response regulator
MERSALEGRFDRLRTALQDLERLQERGACLNDGKPPVLKCGQREIRLDEDCLERLTKRERQVLVCVAQGRTTKELASLLGITFKTASCHRQHVMKKLDVHDAPTLARYAIRFGLVEP